MKKLFNILILGLMIFSFVACSSMGNSKEKTKEDVIAEASMITMEELNKAASRNIIAAQQEYGGKAVIISGATIEEINKGDILIHKGTFTTGDSVCRVNFSSSGSEDILKLEKWDSVNVVGYLKDDVGEWHFDGPGGENWTLNLFTLENAYIY